MTGYAELALEYWDKGWRGVLPISRGTKGPPSKDYTGYGGVYPSYADVMAWIEDRPDDAIALRMPDDVIALDIDHYEKNGKQKRGGDTLAHAESLWGKLPDTYVSSARVDCVSGIRYFKVPAGTRLMSLLRFPNLGLGDVEIIQWGHRYAVVEPSVNPDAAGAPYKWMHTLDWCYTEIPDIEHLPELPPAWLEALKVDEARLELDGIEVDAETILASFPEGEMEMPVIERLDKGIREIGAGASRHDVTNANVLALLRLGEQGWVGVPQALRMLAKVFTASVGPDRGYDNARGEFWRMVTNRQGLAMLVANPSSNTVVNEVDAAELVQQVQPFDEIEQAEGRKCIGCGSKNIRSTDKDGVRLWKCEHCGRPYDTERIDRPQALVAEVMAAGPGWQALAETEPFEPECSEPTGKEVLQVENENGIADDDVDVFAEFWRTRESLAAVRQWGLARMCSPWALLGAVLARALTTVPPWVRLPPVIGGPGSLNFFVALVGPSGTGKGAADSLAAEVLPEDVWIGQAGSGEGLAHQYAHIDKRGEQIIDRTSVLFSVPEIDTLNALGGRTGSTIMSKLREAFSGEELGFGYADASKRIRLGKHGYRLTMVVGVQPSRAAVLLGDAAGGTPQRFIWLPSTDPDISLDRPAQPLPLQVPSGRDWVGWNSNQFISIPDEVAEAIAVNHVARQRGEGDALDGHALFTREKVAFALAVLDGRKYMDSDDWFLSGIVMEKSDETRNAIEKELQKEFQKENEQKGRAQGEMRSAADEIVLAKKVENVRNSILRMLRNGTDTKHALYVGIWSKNREYFEPAYAWLLANDCVVVSDEGALTLTAVGEGWAERASKRK